MTSESNISGGIAKYSAKGMLAFLKEIFLYCLVLKMWDGFFCEEESVISLEVLQERLSNIYQIL